MSVQERGFEGATTAAVLSLVSDTYSSLSDQDVRQKLDAACLPCRAYSMVWRVYAAVCVMPEVWRASCTWCVGMCVVSSACRLDGAVPVCLLSAVNLVLAAQSSKHMYIYRGAAGPCAVEDR